MNLIVKAFFRWRDMKKGDCCSNIHSPASHYDQGFNKKVSSCPREQAWQDYCALRDAAINAGKKKRH